MMNVVPKTARVGTENAVSWKDPLKKAVETLVLTQRIERRMHLEPQEFRCSHLDRLVEPLESQVVFL